MSHTVILESILSFEKRKKSFLDMRDDRMWELIETKPSDIRVDFWFEIFWITLPGVTEKERIPPPPIDILSIDGDPIHDMFLADLYPRLFEKLTTRGCEYILILFFFPTRKSPVVGPMAGFERSLYEKKVGSVTEYDSGKFGERHR